jgi:hypothetical protein
VDGVPTSIVVVIALFTGGYILLNVTGQQDAGKPLGPNSSGDPFIDALASGIAHAEGYFIPFSRPSQNNNPGDITDRNIGGVTATGVDKGGLSIFATPEDGWKALYAKLRNIMAGSSTVYSNTQSLYNLAWTWTGGDQVNGTGSTQNWADKVASTLSDAGWPATSNDNLRDIYV